MKIEELVALLDNYTASGGYYIKPKIENDGNSFFIAKGPASSSDVRQSFASAGDGFGQRDSKDAQTFAGEPRVECAICCNVPNLSDADHD